MRFNLYDLNEFVSKNGSTCHDMYYELVYFELIAGETCQHESDKIINRVKENQTILAQTYLYIILTSKKNVTYSFGLPQSCQLLSIYHTT